MKPRRALIAANWKMNGSRAANDSWLKEFAVHKRTLQCDVVVAAPYVYLDQLRQALGRDEIAAQDVSAREPGAFTGDVAVEMLSDMDCGWVIVGHSERRQWHGETDAMVATKAERALRAGLRPMVCIGETLQQREAQQTNAVLSSQLAAVLDRVGARGLSSGALAYEPVWAIGTGRTASPQQAQEVHEALREQIGSRTAGVRILYGGSVKAANAAELLAQPDIDGALVGGASLIARDFLAICNAVPK
ncbi:MAG TPA: triose-phosphate isomerase [Burkholderiaceae bacterium]|nr:triose-phosphate isomerase [Burkholderiaceae bacterium]